MKKWGLGSINFLVLHTSGGRLTIVKILSYIVFIYKDNSMA